MKRSFPLAALLLCSLLAGCNTFEHRAQQKAALFASLTPEQRDKLKHGVIEIGNSPDMVFLALGQPDEKSENTTAAGTDTLWIYNSYHREYEGDVQTGFYRHVIFNPQTKRYAVYLEPVYSDVYSEHVEENIRITFRDGKVVQIEQPKRS